MKIENNSQAEKQKKGFLLFSRNDKVKWLVSGLLILLVGVGVGGFLVWQKISVGRDLPDSLEMTKRVVQNEQKKEEKVQFTHQIFDPAKVKFIVPLGELNGGYNETQPITGICVNNKGTAEVEVYAPTDMVLESYSYASDGRNTANYHLGFKINNDMFLSFDHITWVPDNTRAVTPRTQNSGTVSPIKKLSFKAGDLIAKTSGTDKAHNWNIYLIDKRVINNFVNQARYESLKDRYAFVNAACPFDYYEDATKKLYIALIGATKAGQSPTCGNPSKDVKGSISGLWHLSKETDNLTFMGSYNGNYATPFSIYKNSAGEIILYEVGRKRYILGASNPTAKDPATVRTSHCYNLTEWPDDSRTNGYAYFQVVNNMEMKLSYSSMGSCPTGFPQNSIIYYR